MKAAAFRHIAEFLRFPVDSIMTWPSRPGEFHPEPLTDPYVNLSIHTARAIQ